MTRILYNSFLQSLQSYDNQNVRNAADHASNYFIFSVWMDII